MSVPLFDRFSGMRPGVVVVTLFFSSFLVADSKEGSCTHAKLKSRLTKHRTRPWVCEGVPVDSIDRAPWFAWALDDPEAVDRMSWKAVRPFGPPLSDDVIWSVEKKFDPLRGLTPTFAARSRFTDALDDGTTFMVESMNSMDSLTELRRSIFMSFGIAGGIDMYVSQVGLKGTPVGSYGWHFDDTDALIYVLRGRKRARVAGYTLGSKVKIDRILGPGSFVYVPGGMFHHLLAMLPDGHAETRESRWSTVLSFGLPNPNADLLHERVLAMSRSLEGRKHRWSTATQALVPKLPTHIVFSDPDAHDATGMAALHRRALRGEVDYVTLLLNIGANIELRTQNRSLGRTALGIALCCAPDPVVRQVVTTLLDRGARVDDVEIRDGMAISARILAAERGLPELVSIIARHGGKISHGAEL